MGAEAGLPHHPRERVGIGEAPDALGQVDIGVAIARDGAVVRRADWAGTALATGDRLEVVRATAGG